MPRKKASARKSPATKNDKSLFAPVLIGIVVCALAYSFIRKDVGARTSSVVGKDQNGKAIVKEPTQKNTLDKLKPADQAELNSLINSVAK